ncbi:MAG: hypothetical protein AAFO74_13015 [Pseudomonadota bacterium]
MNDQFLKEWMEKVERRLEVLEGKSEKPAPAPIPSKPVSNYPRWIYRRNPTSGEVEAMLIKAESELPEAGSFADSPAELDEVEEFQAVVEIPEDWRTMHHSSRIKLAKALPGGDEVTLNDDAIALIELELERRGNAD